MQFLTESDHCGAEATDKGIKTRWRWSLLSEKDKDGIDWREWCKKTDIAGMCLFTACRNSLELSLLDCRKLYITTIYDHDLQLSFQKNEPTVQPTIGIDVFH
jgi:hypothetical protein